MVYCGKPSRGCQICRTRKIRCDEARPTCSQCRKSNRVCPGYRNALDLMFRNESDTVVQRARARGRGRSQRAGGVETARSSRGSSAMPASSLMTPPPTGTVTPSLEDRARTFFFHTYVVADEYPGGPPRGHLEYLPELYSQGGTPTQKLGHDGPLDMALMAVGLAGLAVASGAPGVLEEARATYGKALSATNRDLRDPAMVKEDRTLMAVLMLGIYENVVCNTKRSMQSWKSHIQGAAELMRIRGPEQFKSPVALRLFFQVRRQIVLACLSTEESVPHPISTWAALAEDYQPPYEYPANRHTEIMVALTELRAAIKSNIITSPESIVAAALDLDARLIAWRASLPPDWSYHSLPVAHPDPDVCDGYYDVYPDLWTAQFWNNHRCARVLVHEIVLRYSPAPPLAPEQHRDSAQVFLQMTAEMCASVPFHLGYPAVRTTTTRTTAPRAAGGYFLLWPLYLVGGLETNSEHRRRWIAERLAWIGRTTGIKQGETFAAALRGGKATGKVENTFYEDSSVYFTDIDEDGDEDII